MVFVEQSESVDSIYELGYYVKKEELKNTGSISWLTQNWILFSIFSFAIYLS